MKIKHCGSWTTDRKVMPRQRESLSDANICLFGDPLNVNPRKFTGSISNGVIHSRSFNGNPNQPELKNGSKEKTFQKSCYSARTSIERKYAQRCNAPIVDPSTMARTIRKNGSNSFIRNKSKETSHSVFQPLTARSESSDEINLDGQQAKILTTDFSNISNKSLNKMSEHNFNDSSLILERLSIDLNSSQIKNLRSHASGNLQSDVNESSLSKLQAPPEENVVRRNVITAASGLENKAAQTIQRWFRKKFMKPKQGQQSQKTGKVERIEHGDLQATSAQSARHFSAKSRDKVSKAGTNDDRSLELEENLFEAGSLVRQQLSSKGLKHDNISQRVTSKYAWLAQLENTSSSSGETNVQIPSEATSQGHNGYLTEDKLMSVINYLHSIKPQDVQNSIDQGPTKMSKDSTAGARPAEALSQALSDSRGKTKEPKVAQSDGEEMSKNNFKIQEKKYKETISRHLKFIDQLIGDKKHLTEALEELQNKCKSLTQQFQKEIKIKEENHAIELKKLKDIHVAAEQIKREKWIKTEANRIKELTAKGFEPALQKLISNHKAEIERLKNHHSQESTANEERAKDALRKRELELKKEMEEAVEAAHVEERRICDDESQNKLSQEHARFNKERQKLEERIKKGTEELRRLTEKHKEEFELLKRNMDDAHVTARNVLKREYEDARKEQEARHAAEMKELMKQHEVEKNKWEAEFFNKHREEFSSKEKEMREKLRRERDKEIELALEKLEDEHQAEVERVKKDAESQRRKLQEKHEKELKLIESTEESMCDKNNKLKSALFDAKDEIEKLKVTLKQKENNFHEVNGLLVKRNRERDHLMEVIRQEVADKMAQTEAENVDLNQQICNLKAKHKTEIKKAKSDALLAIKLKDEEVQEIHRRVKDVLSRRAKVEEDLRKERDAAITRADYIQQLLIDKKENAKKKASSRLS